MAKEVGGQGQAKAQVQGAKAAAELDLRKLLAEEAEMVAAEQAEAVVALAEVAAEEVTESSEVQAATVAADAAGIEIAGLSASDQGAGVPTWAIVAGAAVVAGAGIALASDSDDRTVVVGGGDTSPEDNRAPVVTLTQTFNPVENSGDLLVATGFATDPDGNLSRVELRGTDAALLVLTPEANNGFSISLREAPSVTADRPLSFSVVAIDSLGVEAVRDVTATIVNDASDDGSEFNAEVTLAAGADGAPSAPVTANSFFAPPVLFPGVGQVNTLNDEDYLLGTGNNPTLTALLGNSNTGFGTITPNLEGIETINVAFTGSGVSNSALGAAVTQLDLQDADGVSNAINITRISDGVTTATIDNISEVPTDLSISNSGQVNQNVNFAFTANAVSGSKDATTLTVSNVDLASVTLQQRGANPTNGVELLTLSSVGSANAIDVLVAEDLQTLTINGDQDLTLGGTTPVVRTTTTPGQTEAFRYAAGLANVAGSLTTIDASALTGDLDITLMSEASAPADLGTGDSVDFTVTGGSGDDTFRLLANFDSNKDVIVGGKGQDTLQVFNNFNKGAVREVEQLDIRAGVLANTITVNSSLITDLESVLIRNEGQTKAPVTNEVASQATTVTLNNLTQVVANGITVQHSTTGNNSLANNTIVANLANAAGTNDSVGLTIVDQGDNETRGINNEPRFNVQLIAAGVENVRINDRDSESNTVDLGSNVFTGALNSDVAAHSGTLTLEGGKAGQFLNLDATANAYRYDLTGGDADGGVVITGTAGNRSDIGFGAAERFTSKVIDATEHVGNIVVRVAGTSNAADSTQVIRMGSGNDTVIFDQIDPNAINVNRAGLASGHIVDGGAGRDILGIDGEGVRVAIRDTELQNVRNFEVIRFIGNGVADDNSFNLINPAAPNNAYNIRLTGTLADGFLARNGTDVELANGRTVRRVDVINDNLGRDDLFATRTVSLTQGGASIGALSTVLEPITTGGVDVGTGVNRGVTIDATSFDLNASLSYNGAEGFKNTMGIYTDTADRFIFGDTGMNIAQVIDGGRIHGGQVFVVGGGATPVRLAFETIGGVVTANRDILDIRDAAVVDIGDLTNVRNVGTIEFTNTTSAIQRSELELNNATIDRLINDAIAADAMNLEILTVRAIDGNNNAFTELELNALGVTSNAVGFNLTAGGGNDRVFIDGGVAGSNNINLDLGGGLDVVTVRGGAATDTLSINAFGDLLITSSIPGVGARAVVLNNVEAVEASLFNANATVVESALLSRATPTFIDGLGGMNPAVLSAVPGQALNFIDTAGTANNIVVTGYNAGEGDRITLLGFGDLNGVFDQATFDANVIFSVIDADVDGIVNDVSIVGTFGGVTSTIIVQDAVMVGDMVNNATDFANLVGGIFFA